MTSPVIMSLMEIMDIRLYLQVVASHTGQRGTYLFMLEPVMAKRITCTKLMILVMKTMLKQAHPMPKTLTAMKEWNWMQASFTGSGNYF